MILGPLNVFLIVDLHADPADVSEASTSTTFFAITLVGFGLLHDPSSPSSYFEKCIEVQVVSRKLAIYSEKVSDTTSNSTDLPTHRLVPFILSNVFPRTPIIT